MSSLTPRRRFLSEIAFSSFSMYFLMRIFRFLPDFIAATIMQATSATTRTPIIAICHISISSPKKAKSELFNDTVGYLNSAIIRNLLQKIYLNTKYILLSL